MLSGKDTYLVSGLPPNSSGYLKMLPLVNLILDMMKFVKPSSYVMRIKMRLSITILKMSGECVQTLKNITSYWKKHS